MANARDLDAVQPTQADVWRRGFGPLIAGGTHAGHATEALKNQPIHLVPIIASRFLKGRHARIKTLGLHELICNLGHKRQKEGCCGVE